MITRLYIFCGGSIHFIDNEASQLEVAFDLHVEKIESKLQEWKMKTLSQAARTAFSGSATLWLGW